MQVAAIDTETWPIGPGAVVPRLACASFAGTGFPRPVLLSTADGPRLGDLLRRLLEDQEVLMIFHNAAFDVAVLMRAFPGHESLWWEALARRRVTCTMLREMLLNLSTSGNLASVRMPDGTDKKISYGLSDLVLQYFDEDISGSKDGDGWRRNFGLLEGLRADQYPGDAAEYAMADATWCLRTYEAQEARVESESGHASLSVDRFQAATSVALLRITERGMATDPAKHAEVRAWLASELSDERLSLLYEHGILRPRIPPVPYSKQDARARALVGSWLGLAPEDVSWARVGPELRQSLEDAGVKFRGGEGSTKDLGAVKRRILAVALARARGIEVGEVEGAPLEVLQQACEARDVRYRKTPTGEVAAGKEVYEALADHDQVLACYRHREQLGKMVSTEMPRLEWEGKLAPVVHFPFRTLVETGRTSSKASDLYPSANGQNVDPRARPMYVPRPGFLLCSCDYSTLELACVAQVTYSLFGHSVHRDKLLAGHDLHAYLGTRLALELDPHFHEAAGTSDVDEAYPYFKSLEGTRPEYYADYRSLAKPIGLGFPGGEGPLKVVELARRDYGIDVEEIARRRFDERPEEFEATRIVLWYARRIHRMSEEEDFRWTPQLKAVALAARLKEAWLRTYPEMVEYFEWVRAQADETNPVITIKTDDPEEPERDVEGLCYTTPMGMHRARATYTSVANGNCMQSPAAEGFKVAIFDLVRACLDPASESILRGNAWVVNQIHDEALVEVREDLAHDLAMEIRRIMETGMATVLPDVPVKANPCLMRAWRKEAKPARDSRGRLVAWEPVP